MLCPVQKIQSQQQHQKPELQTQSELSILTMLLKLSVSNIPLTCDEKSTFQKHTASPQSEKEGRKNFIITFIPGNHVFIIVKWWCFSISFG